MTPDPNPPSDWGHMDAATVSRIKREIQGSVDAGFLHAIESPALRDQIAMGIKTGLHEAVKDPAIFATMVAQTAHALRQSGKEAAGGIVIDTLKQLGRLAVVALLIYSVAGFPGLAAAWKYLTSTGAP